MKRETEAAAGIALLVAAGIAGDERYLQIMAAVMAVGKPFSPAVATGYASQLTQ